MKTIIRVLVLLPFVALAQLVVNILTFEYSAARASKIQKKAFDDMFGDVDEAEDPTEDLEQAVTIGNSHS